MGLRTDTAATVAMARAQLAQGTYDLCLTDMRLPDGTGLDVIAELLHRAEGMGAVQHRLEEGEVPSVGLDDRGHDAVRRISGIRSTAVTPGPSATLESSDNRAKETSALRAA